MRSGRKKPDLRSARIPANRARAVLGCAALAAALLAAGCSLRRAVLAPVPEALSEVEGYASLKLTQNGETAKSKFSFILELDKRARVEIQDPLGRTAALIFINENEGYFVLGSDKAYWKASGQEIISKFLGTPLGLAEMAGILCGRWPGPSESDAAGWILERDGEGRWASGRRETFAFQVREFFAGSPVPRRVDFQTFTGRGTVQVLAMEFNRPLAASVFDLGFLRGFASKSWEDIERAMRRED